MEGKKEQELKTVFKEYLESQRYIMDDVKNKIGVIILGVILLIFIFGGYFLKNYMVNGMSDKTKDSNFFRIFISPLFNF